MTGDTDPERVVTARLHVLEAPLQEPIEVSFGSIRHRCGVLVELETADGAVGYGESWVNFPSWASRERVATLTEGVLPQVLGTTVAECTRVQRRLVDTLEPIGRQWGATGPVMQAISAVDVALWDLRARRFGVSVSRLVGRYRDRTPVYASGLDAHRIADQASRCVAAGYQAVKLKVGFGRATDTANLAALRDACGDTTVFVDANQGWTLAEAVAMGPVLRDAGVAWVEEPVRGNRLADLEAFHRATGLPVATGENLYGRAAFWDYLASPAVHVVQPDITKSGGFTELFAVCAMAEAAGKEVVPHLNGGALALAASLQVAASAPAVTMVEYEADGNPLRDPLLVDPPRPVDGVIDVPDTPGTGVDLARQELAAVTTQRHVEAAAGR